MASNRLGGAKPLIFIMEVKNGKRNTRLFSNGISFRCRFRPVVHTDQEVDGAAIKGALKDELEEIKKDISDLHNEIRKEDKEKTKNFLVSMLADIERGVEWGDIERQRFYEQYDHYAEDLNGNTYIKTAVEQYEQNGKIWR